MLSLELHNEVLLLLLKLLVEHLELARESLILPLLLHQLFLQRIDAVCIVLQLLVGGLQLLDPLHQLLVFIVLALDLLSDGMLHVPEFALLDLGLLFVLQDQLLVFGVLVLYLIVLSNILAVGGQLQLQVLDLLGQQLTPRLLALVQLLDQLWLVG